NIVVKNIGVEPVVSSSIQIYYDENRDSIAQTGEFLSEINVSSISPNDSVMFNYDITEFTAGQNYYIAVIDVNEFEFNNNNSAFLNFNGVDLNEERGDLIINEIMYSPSSPEPEWIEIFNKSNKIINLLNYQISDENDTSTVIFGSLDLLPNEYLVISKDSTIYDIYPEIDKSVAAYFPTLNNSGDRIMILDSLNRIIDSLRYSSSWGGTNGLSMERIDQNNLSSDSLNWGSSTVPTGGTPGIINSVSQKNYDLELINILFNPELPMLGNDVNISVTIKNIGKEETNFTIELFEDVNLDSSNFVFLESSLLLNLAPSDSLNHSFTHTIMGITKEHAFLLNIIFPEDEDTTNNFAYSTISPGYPQNLIVVNEIMYSPING
ncbi:MAG: lamin tail domain-containing protein, partial [Melioribacteraceae bacterium]|nr:lamin tail domain-containing protein [Melioribacteraceae bacterium]